MIRNNKVIKKLSISILSEDFKFKTVKLGDYTATTANFYTSLVSPGDKATYTITVENKGTIDAELDSINTKDVSSEAILFAIDGINQGDVINAGERITFTVMVSYKSSITAQPTQTSSTYGITLNYVQK